jgi:methylmalonyl-CoA mutase N-terminal domain/subunit
LTVVMAISTKPPGEGDTDSDAPRPVGVRGEASDSAPSERDSFRTLSNEPIRELYTPADLPDGVGTADDPIGLPGEYPFTRGIHPTMYRGRLWTMRQFAGFGTSEETNERFHYLLEHGQTGLSTAFDMPSLMGHDSDSPRSLGEVGREGVAVDTLDDMQTLFSGIDLGEVSVSMTINAPAAIMLAFYVAAAESGQSPSGEATGVGPVPAERLSGTIQADILKEYIAQKEWCFPIDPAMRLCGDMIEWCTRRMPRWHPISISGYHIREAGSTAQQELAFTLKDGLTYVQQAMARGLDVDDFAPRLSFFFNAQIDFFEEIAKYRAARRIWAREMRETFGAKNPRSWQMRFHTQTAGVSLTAQQPLNNIVRTTIEALAGVLGGTQSLHTNSYDEALALPTEEAVTIALRTQQMIAHETGVTNTVDPLGGSYFVEALTDEMEKCAYEYFNKIDELGGMVEATKLNYPQREIADASFALQQEIDGAERVVVGVNRYVANDEVPIDPHAARRPRARAQADRAPAGRTRGTRRWRRGARARRVARGRRARGSQPDGAAARVRPRARQRGRDHRVVAAGLRGLLRDACFLGPSVVRLQPLAPLVVGAPGANALAAHDPLALRLRLIPSPARATARGAALLLGYVPIALGHLVLSLHRGTIGDSALATKETARRQFGLRLAAHYEPRYAERPGSRARWSLRKPSTRCSPGLSLRHRRIEWQRYARDRKS